MKNSGNKTGLFLIELIIALLLFAFCAAICMQVFASARQKAQDSENLSHSVFLATSAAECYKATNGDLARVAELLGDGRVGANAVTIQYDAEWNVLGENNEGYKFYLFLQKNSDNTVSIEIAEDAKADTAKVIYSMVVGMVS